MNTDVRKNIFCILMTSEVSPLSWCHVVKSKLGLVEG